MKTKWSSSKINASIHCSLIVQKFAILERFWMFYLPQYYLKLAPVELVFGAIKKKLRSQSWRGTINFNTNSGLERIFHATAEISSCSAIKNVAPYNKSGKEFETWQPDLHD